MNKAALLFSCTIVMLLAVGCDQPYKEKHEELKSENERLKINFELSKIKTLEEIQILRDSNKVLLDSIRELQWQCNSYEHEKEIVKPSYWLDEYDIEALQELGFKNPQKEILDDLRDNRALFADDGILGGIMQIDSAVLIGTNWALAMGNDGHTGLYYLLEYTVGKNKKIKWKIINKRNIYS